MNPYDRGMTNDDVRRRAEAIVHTWNVTVTNTSETETSILVFGTRQRQPVVVKVIKQEGDEWHSGEFLQTFGGKKSFASTSTLTQRSFSSG
jgi:hypothetical protein